MYAARNLEQRAIVHEKKKTATTPRHDDPEPGNEPEGATAKEEAPIRPGAIFRSLKACILFFAQDRCR